MGKKTTKIEVKGDGIFIETGIVDTEETESSPVKTNKAPTHAILVLDQSGSMEPQKKETIQGINSWIQNQKETTKEIGDEMHVTLVLFNSSINVIFENKNIEDVSLITDSVYVPHGSTALWDALDIGVQLANKSISNNHNVLLVIDTDGEENYSRVCVGEARETLKNNISKFNDQGSMCKIVYLGASQDAWANAQSYGFHTDSVANYSIDKQVCKYSSLDHATTTLRSCAFNGVELPDTIVGTMASVNEDIKIVKNK